MAVMLFTIHGTVEEEAEQVAQVLHIQVQVMVDPVETVLQIILTETTTFILAVVVEVEEDLQDHSNKVTVLPVAVAAVEMMSVVLLDLVVPVVKITAELETVQAVEMVALTQAVEAEPEEKEI
jgi:hypothetical protein